MSLRLNRSKNSSKSDWWHATILQAVSERKDVMVVSANQMAVAKLRDQVVEDFKTLGLRFSASARMIRLDNGGSIRFVIANERWEVGDLSSVVVDARIEPCYDWLVPLRPASKTARVVKVAGLSRALPG